MLFPPAVAGDLKKRKKEVVGATGFEGLTTTAETYISAPSFFSCPFAAFKAPTIIRYWENFSRKLNRD
jgi:hypothetical protein